MILVIPILLMHRQTCLKDITSLKINQIKQWIKVNLILSVYYFYILYQTIVPVLKKH